MRTAIYPGTFDPITNGHTDIVERGAKIFDRLIVAIADSSSKGPCFSFEERLALANEALAGYTNVEVQGFNILLADFAKEVGAEVILRGLRAVSDFEYEFQLAGMNRSLAPQVQTIFLPASQPNAYVSASLVREVARLGGDVSEFVHPSVLDALHKKLG